MADTDARWQFWIDRGGTFTDIVALHPDGSLSSHKYLSENPGQYEDAAVHAMRMILKVPEGAPFPNNRVQAIKMGTTVATNALLERAGEPTLLLVTKGFEDALLIGQQHRADLFALKPTRPKPLYSAVAGIRGRKSADGTTITPFDAEGCRTALASAFAEGLRSVAVAFLHGYRYPEDEAHAGRIAADLGFTQISMSHQVSPLMKLIPRGDTTVADAYLSPVLRCYVQQVAAATGDTPLYFMQSNGGLAAARAFEGKDAVLSGPAGGIVGAAQMATRAGFDQIVGFDMGGTSTDVSHFAGSYERVFDTIVAGVRMTVPMMDIHTVAAGGGSICQIADGRFRVGPQSAGAYPGPAAYGRGGPVTVTDCNVMLGRLAPDLFPNVFGETGDAPLDITATRRGFEALQHQVRQETGNAFSLEAIAEGFLKVAVGHMARAIKRVSVERGHDIKKHALLTFGGAGGQHACAVADALGINTVIVPPYSGVLSALGMGLASERAMADHAVEEPLENIPAIEAAAADARARALQALPGASKTCEVHMSVRVKYSGADSTLAVPLGPLPTMRKDFEKAHRAQFGFTEEGRTIIAEAVEAEAVLSGSTAALKLKAYGTSAVPLEYRQIYAGGMYMEAAIHERVALKAGVPVAGPAMILEKGGTTIVEPGWTATLKRDDTLILKRTEPREGESIDPSRADPVMLEIFNNLFMSVAEEMGGVLAKTAHSVNIKERLDFSCAVFDRDGNLIANAPHMPVHLGSMGDSVVRIISRRGVSMQPGDSYMLNDPFAGGTHLPDITVITPVFMESDRTAPHFFVASRGHHADIGGITPGSMPPHSTSIEDEGIRFDDFTLVHRGQFAEEAVIDALTAGPHPSRNVPQNIADLKAQVAANERGVALVRKLAADFGLEVVDAYMGHVQDNAEEAVRRLIDRLQDGSYSYPMDCGAMVKVRLTTDKAARTVTVDFNGTSPTQPTNFNAPLSVTKAAVLYVFRTLTGEDIPLNAGCMKSIKLIVPEGSMLNPTPPAAVVAGNVETSQVVTNALFLAAGAMAGAQGTMNNLTFGNEAYQYYETIAGGTGAGPGFDGTDAIQSHMTNSRLTDPEVLEWRYPVRVEAFGIRSGSGGKGRWHGGAGAHRAIRFLEEMEVSILSGHRTDGPPGLMGGKPGMQGETRIIRTDGSTETLKASDSATVHPGDMVVIDTPGGGGFGA